MTDWLAIGRREFERAGEDITLRRIGTPDTSITVRAKVRAYGPEELVGGITQQDREIRVLAEGVTFSPTLRPGDKAIMQGRTLNIDAVDASTGRAGGDLVFYILRAKG